MRNQLENAMETWVRTLSGIEKDICKLLYHLEANTKGGTKALLLVLLQGTAPSGSKAEVVIQARFRTESLARASYVKSWKHGLCEAFNQRKS